MQVVLSTRETLVRADSNANLYVITTDLKRKRSGMQTVLPTRETLVIVKSNTNLYVIKTDLKKQLRMQAVLPICETLSKSEIKC